MLLKSLLTIQVDYASNQVRCTQSLVPHCSCLAGKDGKRGRKGSKGPPLDKRMYKDKRAQVSDIILGLRLRLLLGEPVCRTDGQHWVVWGHRIACRHR